MMNIVERLRRARTDFWSDARVFEVLEPAAAEIDRLQATLGIWQRQFYEQKAEIARLQELLRGVGANRYWEGRWRDETAENERLRAALEEISHMTLSEPMRGAAKRALGCGGRIKDGSG